MKPPQRHIRVRIEDQSLTLTDSNDKCLMVCPVSTSSRGTGFEPGSYKTPTGNFRIHRKIGAGQPEGTVFSAREPVGIWSPNSDASETDDLILTRILQLDGLDPENANTLERYIYFHGTNHEALIGTPASHGCIRLRNDDMLRLFDLVSDGDLVVIS
jgi:lipoprotein-anchoring transpeptidase ErfK/SrfK